MELFSTAEETQSWPITEVSQVGAARRGTAALSERLGFDETAKGKVSIVVTEAATNLLKHAQGGELIVRTLPGPTRSGLEILALDNGPGIADPATSLADGYSTAGSSGNGLGAMTRLSSFFDLYSVVGRGTAVLLELWPDGPAPGPGQAVLDSGCVSVTKSGEDVSGDAWAITERTNRVRALVVDGLGHGLGAADAAREAVRVFQDDPDLDLTTTLEFIHGALKKTRGAAVAIAEIDRGREICKYVGVGNIVGTIVEPGAHRSLVSHNGTAGHEIRKIQEFTSPWNDDALLIMHSDGLSARWNLDAYPGLTHRRPGLIAGVLYRDFSRRRDDATVLVVKRA